MLRSMFRYADPLACPGCRTPMESGTRQCDSCGLPLTGQLAQQLFTTLTTADSLLARMRVPVAVAAGPAPPPTRPPSGLSAASVPRILLGLGATCLLVAALVFLAVAWSALGVGGRTGVVVLLTVAAGVVAAWMARADLRAGAESFATVALGLVVLDVTGADRAGWLGDPTLPALLMVIGIAVGVPGAAAALAARRTPVGTLHAADAFAALGVVLATAGLVGHDAGSDGLRVSLAAVLAAAVGYAAWRVRLSVATAGATGIAALWWLALVAVGAAELDALEVAELWGELDVRWLLVAALLPALVVAVRDLPLPLRAAAASAAVVVGNAVLTLPAWDGSATTRALVELAVVAGAAVLSGRVPLPWRWLTGLPALAAGLLLLTSAAALGVQALEGLLGFSRPWQGDLTAAVDVPDLAWSWPLLLPAGALGALVALWVLARCGATLPASQVAWWLVPAAIVTVTLVPVLYAAPLGVALLGLALGAAAGAGIAAYARRIEPVLASAVLGLLLFVAAFADEWSTLVVLGLVAAASAVPALRADGLLGVAAGGVLTAAGGGFLWTAGELADVDPSWRALPVLALVAAYTLVRPGLDREIPAYAAGAVAATASVLAHGEVDQTWLAVYLTVGGVVLTASALLHPDRRELGWGGLALFTLAQWVRLQQLGVDTVEAYTLPLGLVLVTIGLIRLARTDVPSMRALSSGLGLCLVPTLLQVLLEPVSTRALLLGLACALLVGVGVVRRWSAPLLIGASVGLVVVLRESVHASVLPQWVVIGIVGIVLTVVGVTWERRLAELRAAAGYVRRLR